VDGTRKGSVDEHRDYAVLKLQPRLDLNTHKIYWIIKTTASLIVPSAQPVLANDGEHDIALGDLAFQLAHEGTTRCSAVDVHEKFVRREGLPETIVQAARETTLITPYDN